MTAQHEEADSHWRMAFQQILDIDGVAQALAHLDAIYGDHIEFADGGFPDPADNESCVIGYLDDPIASVGDNVTAEILVRVGFNFQYCYSQWII